MITVRTAVAIAIIALVGGAATAAGTGSSAGTTANASLLAPSPILTATAGLLAFQIGLYTLVGRERKSPYIINSVFPVFLFCLVIASITIASALVPDWMEGWFLWTSAVLLVATFLFSAFRVFRIAVRFIYFVDSVHPKHLPNLHNDYLATSFHRSLAWPHLFR
jgi:hypothetical protein